MARLRPQRRRRTARYVLASATVLAGITAASFIGHGQTSSPAQTSDGERAAVTTTVLSRRETRATLDPARFTGTAAQAYRVAREIPDVLDQLQCYCACGGQYGHVSLLSCYTDGHGST